MAPIDSRRTQLCRRFVPLTYFVFMTSSLISNLIGLSSAQKIADSTDLIFYNNSTNQTKVSSECHPCPRPDDKDTSVGVILGSAIAGVIVGGVVTAALMTWIRNRSRSPPPKDYDGRDDDQAHFDVNRNDEIILTNGGDKDVEEGTDPSNNKAHKKLERLVQRNPYQKPVDFNTEMASLPLIHNTDSSSDDAQGRESPQIKLDNASAATTTTTTTGVVSPKRPDKPPTKTGQSEDVGYLNIGERSLLEQPYDALAVVPEEVEYENDKQHVYEPILQETGASRA